MDTFSIKDLADFSGLKQHTIRIWEQRYSFLRPGRFPHSTHRYYTADDLHLLLDVVLLNQNGYRVSKIDKMSLEEKVATVEKVLDKQQKAIHQLIIQMARMNAQGFEAVLEESTRTWGIHPTIEQVLLPFCDIAGLLMTNSEKNYVENILVVRQSIKQWISMGIQKAAPVASQNKTVLLFLLSGDVQELTLLYLQYLVKGKGYTTLYLGQQVKVEQLQAVCRQLQPDFILTHLSKKGSHNKDLREFVEGLQKDAARTTFISFENELPLKVKASDTYKHADTIGEILPLLTKVAETELA